MPHTRYEIEMFHNIGKIARSLERIANCLEAAELRARASDPQAPVHAGSERGVHEEHNNEGK